MNEKRIDEKKKRKTKILFRPSPKFLLRRKIYSPISGSSETFGLFPKQPRTSAITDDYYHIEVLFQRKLIIFFCLLRDGPPEYQTSVPEQNFLF